MSEEKVTLILGAGATLADGLRKPIKNQPPLDHGFFKNVLQSHGNELAAVTKYMRDYYDATLTDPAWDSLEHVMAVLYTDLFGGELEQEAYKAFVMLIRVYNVRLATTTEDIPMTPRCLMYRVIVDFLNKGLAPSNITVISFNQDIQAEKALDAIQHTKGRMQQRVFSFPQCYHLPKEPRLTAPSRGGQPLFDIGQGNGSGIALLKLHGSLNWYSTHNTPHPRRQSLFDPTRVIGITRRKTIDTSMRVDVRPGARKIITFPMVVPPVVHKSGILHRDLRPVWSLAEERLKTANKVIIFGYSCPPNDWEAANLVCRALTQNAELTEVSVIDPEPNVLLRYVGLGNLNTISYYRSAAAYLGAE